MIFKIQGSLPDAQPGAPPLVANKARRKQAKIDSRTKSPGQPIARPGMSGLRLSPSP